MSGISSSVDLTQTLANIAVVDGVCDAILVDTSTTLETSIAASGFNVRLSHQQSSGFVAIASGGSANAFGSYVELVSSTSASIDALLIGFNGTDAAYLDNIVLKIGVGGAGSEADKYIIPYGRVDWGAEGDGAFGLSTPLLLYVAQIGTGVRVAACVADSVAAQQYETNISFMVKG